MENTTISILEAAEFLNVSEKYMVGLLNDKKLPFEGEGEARRVLIDPLKEYKIQRNIGVEEVLQMLVDMGQKMGDYD